MTDETQLESVQQQQTATETEPEQKIADGDEQSAPDLNALLNEYDEGVKQEEQQQEVKTDQMQQVVNYVQDQQEKEVRQQTDKDLATAVDTIQGDLKDLNIPNRAITGYLQQFAGDQRFLNAYGNRHKNPAGWNTVLRAVGKEIKNDFAVDQKVTTDRESLNAAVREQSTNAPAQASYSDMSGAEFDEMKRGLNRG